MNNSQKNIKAYLFLTLAALFWSGNFIVGKAASFYAIPPFSLNFYRWLFAFLILLPFTYQEVINNRIYVFQNLGLFILLGITSITIFNSVVYYSLYFTQVISGILMISTIPVWILFFATMLKIEKTNIFQISGVFLSLTGVLFIVTRADLELVKQLEFNKGDLSMVIGMLSWAIYSALLRKKTHPLSQIALLEIIIICGFIFLTPIYFIEIILGNKIVFGIPFVLTLSYVVFFPGIFAFLFWIKGIDMIGANRAGVFLHLMTIFGALMAIFILGEKFMFYHFLGAIFIIAGITLSNKTKKDD